MWEKLSIGSELLLERDVENRYDPNVVAIIYRDKSDEQEYLLGYVPREENKTLAILLEMGYKNIFECRLSKKDETAHYENQLHVIIKIKRTPIA